EVASPIARRPRSLDAVCFVEAGGLRPHDIAHAFLGGGILHFRKRDRLGRVTRSRRGESARVLAFRIDHRYVEPVAQSDDEGAFTIIEREAPRRVETGGRDHPIAEFLERPAASLRERANVTLGFVPKPFGAEIARD